MTGAPSQGRVFDRVPDLYDEVRPDYPDELYRRLEQATGPLRGLAVLDLAAGPGLAARQLRARGADVVAVDPGLPLLRRLRARSPQVPAVAGVGERLPFRPGVFDLVTCATAWHWLDAGAAVGEARRVTRAPGWLALWWANHRWGDGVDWEDAQSQVLDRYGLGRGSRAGLVAGGGVGPREAAADLRARGLEVVSDSELRWERRVTRERHLQVLATHSDNLALGPRLPDPLADLAAALRPWPVLTERLWGPLVVARLRPVA